MILWYFEYVQEAYNVQKFKHLPIVQWVNCLKWAKMSKAVQKVVVA